MQQILYLSRADIAAAAIDPTTARDAVISAFADPSNRGYSKNIFKPGSFQTFQSMVASSRQDIVTMKWIGMSTEFHALICLNDLSTGAAIAIMDGNLITSIRTAAMSAAAASFLAPLNPRVLGFVGSGTQARAHLEAFPKLYPSLRRVCTSSRSIKSAKALADQAISLGLSASTMSVEEVVRQSDIIITTVPASQDLKPFLNPSWLKPRSFVASVDVGRSWISDKEKCFDLVATDSIAQIDALRHDDPELSNLDCSVDLLALSRGEHPGLKDGRAIFAFKGFALGDLAIAKLIYEQAIGLGLGTKLQR